jgi:signal transduction histidine kinase
VAAGEENDRQPVAEVAEEVGRDAATLALRRAQLELAEQAPEVRRVAFDLAAAAICGLALLTAFVFGNWAVASALSSSLPGWQAPLVLAAVWAAIGLVAAGLLERRKHLLGGLLADRTDTMRRRRAALEEAEHELRDTLGRLSDAIAQAAEDRIAAAILPLAGGMVEVGEGMVEATDDVVEAADEITDVIEETVPGGVVVNRAFDVALAPGRFGIRVARSAFKISRDET